MRVFGNTAFFWFLIKQTVNDILPFLIMLSIIMLLFANVLYVINMGDPIEFTSDEPCNKDDNWECRESIYAEDIGY